MIYEYDDEVDGLYIWLLDDLDKEKENYENEIWPIELKEEIGLLFDKNNKLMGLEIQPASKYLDLEKILKRKS